MKKLLFTAALSALVATPVLSAGHGMRFINPCDRGPIPSSSFINEVNNDFITFLQNTYAGMNRDTAFVIANQLCSDMSLVGDDQGLTRRLQTLVRQFGY